MKIGDYARTKKGEIIKVFEYNGQPNNPLWESINCVVQMKGTIVNSSPDIIDLLESWDLLYIDIDPYDGYGGITVPRIAETEAELDRWKKKIIEKEWVLKSVVTKEKLEENEYIIE